MDSNTTFLKNYSFLSDCISAIALAGKIIHRIFGGYFHYNSIKNLSITSWGFLWFWEFHKYNIYPVVCANSKIPEIRIAFILYKSTCFDSCDGKALNGTFLGEEVAGVRILMATRSETLFFLFITVLDRWMKYLSHSWDQRFW